EVLAGHRIEAVVVRIGDLGRIVEGRDADGDDGGGGAAMAIVHQYGEAVRAVVGGRWYVRPGAVMVDGDGAVLRPARQAESERVAIHIGGLDLAGDGRVLGRGEEVLADNRIEVVAARVGDLGRI